MDGIQAARGAVSEGPNVSGPDYLTINRWTLSLDPYNHEDLSRCTDLHLNKG